MALAEQCMQFAIEMLHLCRSAKEVEVLLSRPVNIEGHELIDPLAYIKLGLQCNEKKVIFKVYPYPFCDVKQAMLYVNLDLFTDPCTVHQPPELPDALPQILLPGDGILVTTKRLQQDSAPATHIAAYTLLLPALRSRT